MIENYTHKGLKLAIVIRANYQKEGIAFFTNENDSQQLGYMNRPKGYSIEPHRHNIVIREVHLTQEVLLVKSGKIRVDLYDNEQNYIESTLLSTGDVILLADGGHGFTMIEKTEMIEIKQGPYFGEKDKLRFKTIDDDQVIINKNNDGKF